MMRFVLLLAASVVFGTPALAAGVIVPAEQRYMPFSGAVESCDNPGVLDIIAHAFAAKEEDFWSRLSAPSLTISSIDRVKEVGFRSDGVAYIPRRYCMAEATISDHRVRPVLYQVQEWMGFSGYGDGVEWCVVGLDHNFAYAPACTSLKPIFWPYLNDRVRTQF